MKIDVDLPSHSYEIVIERGILSQIGEWVSSLWKTQKLVLISDSQVDALYGNRVFESLKASGFDVAKFVFPKGEASKNLQTASEAWDFCARAGLTRSDGIIALGGGVVGDLAGFVASTYMRGIHF